MKEYTILGIVAVLLTVYLDKASHINLLKKKGYYVFILVILFFKMLVNGYLTGKQIVMYRPQFFLGLRIGSIPLEDFLFGFSMVTLTIIFWEYFKKEQAC
ncbi:MAG: lycopene cyclase domain-containing protein [Candidatus Omnitrophota bacterium]